MGRWGDLAEATSGLASGEASPTTVAARKLLGRDASPARSLQLDGSSPSVSPFRRASRHQGDFADVVAAAAAAAKSDTASHSQRLESAHIRLESDMEEVLDKSPLRAAKDERIQGHLREALDALIRRAKDTTSELSERDEDAARRSMREHDEAWKKKIDTSRSASSSQSDRRGSHPPFSPDAQDLQTATICRCHHTPP
jgi:hypothetical protein